MPPFDPEISSLVQDHLTQKGVSLCLGNAVAGFEQNPDGTLTVSTQSGGRHQADMVILSIGISPETGLAKASCLKIVADVDSDRIKFAFS